MKPNIALLLAALSSGLLISSIIIGSKAKEALKKAQWLKIEAEATEETAKETKEFLNSLISVGKPLRYYIRKNDNCCDVMAQYDTFADRKTTDNVIKRFDFADGESYALREAEYLLKTLNEK